MVDVMPKKIGSEGKPKPKLDPNAGWLREGLKKPGKSQRGLAKFLDMNDATVHRMIYGGRSIRHEELQKIAVYLGVSIPKGGAIKTVPVRGVLIEGTWRLRDENVIRPSQEMAVAIPSRIPPEDQFAYEVIMPGQPIAMEYFVSPKDLGRDVREGDKALVQEERGEMVREIQGVIQHIAAGLAVTVSDGARAPILLTQLVLLGVSIGTFTSRDV